MSSPPLEQGSNALGIQTVSRSTYAMVVDGVCRVSGCSLPIRVVVLTRMDGRLDACEFCEKHGTVVAQQALNESGYDSVEFSVTAAGEPTAITN